jgi:hypothetical protein
MLAEELLLRQLHEAHHESGDLMEMATARLEEHSERQIRLKLKKMGLIVGDSRVWTEEVRITGASGCWRQSFLHSDLPAVRRGGGRGRRRMESCVKHTISTSMIVTPWNASWRATWCQPTRTRGA